ncbi:hypothetical protein GCM10009863_50920 [Streptomyces axinellae]|uniref:Chorismate mutase n=1 Tax=Streptomyces axinellae TaxID=552788 RepID=A0ABN3QLJ6_9ACTN
MRCGTKPTTWPHELHRCCRKAGQELDPAFAEKLLNFIIAEVIRHHEQIAQTGSAGGGEADETS